MNRKRTIKQILYGLSVAVLLFAANIAYAQNNSLVIKCNNEPLKKVLQQISDQTGYKFIYTDKVKTDELKITLDCKDESLSQVLAKALSPLGLSYIIKDNQIILSTKEIINSTPAQTQKILSLNGVIVDDLGEPIPGASVENLNSKQIVATNDNGMFSINAQIGDNIAINSIGMDQKLVKINNGSNLSIILNPSSVALSDVVVTGYQTLSKERSTGSFAVITSSSLEKKLQPSLSSILEGQSAGVVLSKDGKMEIRGVSTINGNKEPLIVLNGYPLIGDGVGLESINPDNIENITILKDAVAASIYGSRASNGVIVITTKSAKKGTISVGYKGSYSINLKPDLKKLNLSSTEDFMDAELDLYNQNPNSYLSSYNTYYRLSDYTYLLMAKDRGMITPEEADKQISLLSKNNALQQIEDNLIRARQTQQHSVNLSAGSDKNLFNAVVRYVGEAGSLKYDKSNKFYVDIDNDWKPTNWFSFKIFSNINYNNDQSSYEGWQTLTRFDYDCKMYPYTQLYDESGNATPFMPVGQRRIDTYNTYPGMKSVYYHPETDIANHLINYERLQVRLGGNINVKFADFLSGSVGGSWIKGSTTNKTIADAKSFMMRSAYNDGTSATNPTKHYIPDGGKIDENRGTIMSWVLRAQLNFNKTLANEKHRITAMLGSEISKDTYERTYMPTRLGYDPISATYNSGFSIHDYNNNVNNMSGDMLFQNKPQYLGTLLYGGSTLYNSDYGVRDNRFVSWYGNASYEFNNRYQVTGSIRLDLTNFFGTDPKYRYKPTWSVGGNYRISEEEFFADFKHIINRLNLRASYGVNGNISLNNTPYLILQVGAYDPTMGGVSYGVNSYPNNQLRWEKTNILNIGLEFGVLNNRLNIGVDYYNKKSTDLIANEQVDQTLGMTSLPQNVGGVTNRGVEITLNGDVIRKGDFSWNSSLIASYNKSNVNYYNVSMPYFGSYAKALPQMVQGYPMDGFWGGRFAGLDEKGTALYYNKAGDKVEGGSLKGEDAVYLGTQRPPLDMSWTNSFSYKNWDLSFMFIGKFGHKYRKDNFSGSNYNNRHVSERWREPGDEATKIYPKLTSWNMDMFYYPYSDHLVASANYVKLRDLTLAYNFPKKWISKIKLTNLKLYFQTRNLFYITAKGVDIDPEIAELNVTGGTGAMTSQGFTSLQLRPEFFFGISVNL